MLCLDCTNCFIWGSCKGPCDCDLNPREIFNDITHVSSKSLIALTIHKRVGGAPPSIVAQFSLMWLLECIRPFDVVVFSILPPICFELWEKHCPEHSNSTQWRSCNGCTPTGVGQDHVHCNYCWFSLFATVQVHRELVYRFPRERKCYEWWCLAMPTVWERNIVKLDCAPTFLYRLNRCLGIYRYVLFYNDFKNHLVLFLTMYKSMCKL